MTTLYIVPSWFLGVSIGLEIIFALITVAVAFYSLKIYRLSEEKEFRLLGAAFIIISISYILRSALNAFIITKVNTGTIEFILDDLQSVILFGVFAHMILFIVGLITLLYLTMRVKNDNVYVAFICLALLSILLSANRAIAFYVVSSVVLLFIAKHYLLECRNLKNPKRVLVAGAFVLLLIANLDYIFATKNYTHYIIAHVLELVAYMFILASLTITVKNEQKKK